MKEKIWKYDQEFYKVYTEDPDLKDKMREWEGCKPHCYYYDHGKQKGWDFLVPKKFNDKLVKLIRNKEH